MARVLITAFEPYQTWAENASWLALVELTRELPAAPEVVTRRYPVDYRQVHERLERDLAGGFDVALHLGQAPGSAAIQLEAIGLNLASNGDNSGECGPLVDEGPVAYRSSLPLVQWAGKLRKAGVPAQVSHHAGTYLCNATLYLSHYLSERNGWKTRSVFVHLPLEPSQVVQGTTLMPSLPRQMAAHGLRLLLEELEGRSNPTSQT